MKWWFCLFVVFGVAVGVGTICRFEFAKSATTCVLCHEIKDSRARMAESPHKDVDCKACHGGTFSALGDNVKRGFKHLRGVDYSKFGNEFMLSERQVEEMCARCAKCHAAEAAQWAASGHGKPASTFLQDAKHNAAWKPADHCLKCHGMFLEGDISANVARSDLARRRAIPCLACHQMHAREPLQLYSRNERESYPAASLSMQRIVAADGHEVKRAGTPANRLCVACHAANAEGVAGSADDRTPLGAQEGMACTDCHRGHDRKADASRGRCPLKAGDGKELKK